LQQLDQKCPPSPLLAALRQETFGTGLSSAAGATDLNQILTI
jgi:hypothetical protein